MNLSRLNFDESRDEIELNGPRDVLLCVAWITTSIIGCAGALSALGSSMHPIPMGFKIGVAGFTLACGFAWAIGLKGKALNTLGRTTLFKNLLSLIKN